MNIRMLRLLAGLFVGIIMLGATSCSRQPESREQDLVEVRKVLEIRDKAIENKDISLFKTIIYEDYFDGGAPLELILSELEAAFRTYPSIDFTYQKSPVEFKMNTARVVQRIIYKVDGESKGRHGHERLMLRKINDKWVISGGVQTGLLMN